MERRLPDYRFRFHTQYRLPGQRPMALALRGGSAKGLAHLGVLQGLDEENLPVDAMVGTSAGSLMGSLYASGFSGEGVARIFKSRDFGRALDDRQRVPGWSLSEDEIAHTTPFRLEFRNSGLDMMPGGRPSARVRAMLMPMLGRASWLAGGNFDDLRMPLRVVTSDLTVGQGRVFGGGSLVDVVMASTCLPGIFEPVMIQGHQFVDGGPYENLPVRTSRKAFPGMVQVGVAIGKAWDPAPKTNLLTLMDASLDLAMAQIEAANAAEADLIIRPEMAKAEEFDFYHQVDALVVEGREAFLEQRPLLENLLYGPAAQVQAAAGLDLQAVGVEGAEAWLAALDLPAEPAFKDLYRVLRRAYRDLAIQNAEIHVPGSQEGRAVLVLRPAALIKRLDLDLPESWGPTYKVKLEAFLLERYHLGVGLPFHEGAWSRAIEGLLVEGILNQAPILDLQGSGLQEDSTLRVRVREPLIEAIQSKDPLFQERLARFLEPATHEPARTDLLEERLARAATRLGLSHLRPDFQQDHGKLVLALDPERAPGFDLAPHLAYESTWGGQLGLDLAMPNFLGTGSQLQVYGAVNDLQTRLQGEMLGVFSGLPNLAMGVFGSVQHQWFKNDLELHVEKMVVSAAGLRTQGRFGMEDRGRVVLDLGHTEGFAVVGGSATPQDKASFGRLAAEWDSLDSHTLATRGLMVRTAFTRVFQATSGPSFNLGYLRLRQTWAPAPGAFLPFGLVLDGEIAVQHNAPLEHWFIAGGPDSFIGTPAASFLAPNFEIYRLGLPFTVTNLFGMAVQVTPRVDAGLFSDNFRRMGAGQRALGTGVVFRGILRSLYVELGVGTAKARNETAGEVRRDHQVSFLIGTRPFDLWKGR
jgi:predicted acylesterase/phospholipase RssA